MSSRIVIAALVVAAPALAKPPAIEGFVRIDEFNQLLAGKFQDLRREEEFQTKPYPEQLVIKWEQGATSFKKMRKIKGPDVVDEVFEWDEMLSETPSDAAKRLLKLLPEVVGVKYGAALKLDAKQKYERYEIGKTLVDHLVKSPVHVRQLAIDCLFAMHKTRQNYVATDDEKKRQRGHKLWAAYIKRLKS